MTPSRIFFWIKPSLVDRYVILQSLSPFIISLSVVLVALLMERLLLLFNLLADSYNPFSRFLGMLTDLVPHYLGLALPSALCVSIYSVVRRLNLNNEIDTMMSSGLSLLQITRSYIVMGIVFGIASLFLYGFIQPYARYDYRAAFYFASHSGWVPHLQAKMIVSPNKNLMITAESVKKHGSLLSHVFIEDDSTSASGKAIKRTITATKGNLILSSDRSKVEIDLFDGRIITQEEDHRPTITNFSHTTKILSQQNHIPAFRSRGDDERELTLPELKQAMKAEKNTISHSDLRGEYHFRLVRTLSFPFIPMLATALAISSKRQKRNNGLFFLALTLIGYDNILQLGANLVSSGKHTPFAVIWLPYLIFSFLCLYLLYYKSGGRVGFLSAHIRKFLKRKQGHYPHTPS
ncbi:LptF/LptG family permease [Entomobacter blattae]|uniref:Lipopolysaccharide export system permease LptF/LptG n=1 Tax=Entomobacter blattae TaxID=2762277 RepID=A0A7H1NPA2_9PROT|nr:LptF/LptG family permease [Entomobacter blattae]QNT77612.1 Lipopolysaccharide export system permease LptF/LptG [Entomobacter blattae]